MRVGGTSTRGLVDAAQTSFIKKSTALKKQGSKPSRYVLYCPSSNALHTALTRLTTAALFIAPTHPAAPPRQRHLVAVRV